MNEKPQPTTPGRQIDCQRCATCCRKGGPTLHQDDRWLVEQGLIPAKDLFTIRQGEMARDNVRGGMVAVARDHIKIKGSGSGWTCRYLDEGACACRIYDLRPLECRALKCWDASEIERICGRDLLTREDLLSDVAGLWELVADHQSRCDYEKARRLIQRLPGDRRGTARRELSAMVQYDAEIRRLVLARGGLDSELLEFLFGRPLGRTLGASGLKLQP